MSHRDRSRRRTDLRREPCARIKSEDGLDLPHGRSNTAWVLRAGDADEPCLFIEKRLKQVCREPVALIEGEAAFAHGDT